LCRESRSPHERPHAAPASHLGLLLVAVLASSAWSNPKDVPAVIANPSPESAKELNRVIHKALPGLAVTLADDALTKSSLLSLEHALHRDPMGQTLNGRDLSRPETFELFKRDSRCILKQLRTRRSFELHHIQCTAVSSAN